MNLSAIPDFIIKYILIQHFIQKMYQKISSYMTQSYAARLPVPGETLHGKKFTIGFGGKGANQCVSAAKLGASTALIARLGDDSFGKNYLDHLQSIDINVKNTHITPDISSGMAQIIVAETGENQIVIVAGANNELSEEDIDCASDLIKAADVVIFQLETPTNTTLKALELTSNFKGISILNAAPAVSDIDPKMLTLPTIFCVNETEAELISGLKVASIEDAGSAIAHLLQRGCNTVIITLGPRGVVFASKQKPKPFHIPARKVEPIDTTGAGDSFIGTMGYFLAYHPHLSMEEIISRSCEVATYSVLSAGTQTSFPTRSDLTNELFN